MPEIGLEKAFYFRNILNESETLKLIRVPPNLEKLDPRGLLHDDVLRSGTIRGIRTPRQNPQDGDCCMSSD